MKKTFRLTHPKIKFARLVDSARADIHRYIRRERKRALPTGVDFWDFSCRVGVSAEDSATVHVADIGKFIDTVEEQGLESFYVEILAKPGHRSAKP